ncbi:hypothetical protein ACNRPI_005687 [Klebsiella pneumoniae]|uniref:hypothetical protein n=1 Tax=Klebsiella oxytoca TaxID=571 RepID=UPI002A0A34B2|nr:hypothetical protein [Klebsiella oxytoca]
MFAIKNSGNTKVNFIKILLLLLVVSLLVYGFTSFTGKESIAIAVLGFGLSAVIISFVGIMIVLLVALYLFSSSSISIYPKMLFMEGLLLGWWHFLFNVIIPDGNSLTLLGVNIYNLGSYILYGMTVLIGIGIVMMMFQRSTTRIDKI